MYTGNTIHVNIVMDINNVLGTSHVVG